MFHLQPKALYGPGVGEAWTFAYGFQNHRPSAIDAFFIDVRV